MIKFENETENFESIASKSLNPINFLTTTITIVNNSSKRMAIPKILKARFAEEDSVKLLYNVNTGDLRIDFRPTSEIIVPEEVECKDVKILQTGWGYYITLPSKWFKYVKPKKASLTQLEERQTTYQVRLYG
jgi:hypothetical protein